MSLVSVRHCFPRKCQGEMGGDQVCSWCQAGRGWVGGLPVKVCGLGGLGDDLVGGYVPTKLM